MTGGSIKAIDRESVHRIHSGQVVLDLQGVIKELVENAFDSGATSVDVRMKDHGLDSVEVVDNGSGIEQADWSSIGLKHHTSKLPSFEELAQVSTFGFRGEAIAALCALCESVTVVTATKDTAPMGAVIKLGRNGHVLDDKGRVARQRGTTVTLTGLFKALPVRRKEFERTAKREFTRALGILTAYALVPASVSASDGRAGVRLKVEAIGAGKGGKRNTVLATDGRGALKSSVSAVWGPKALEGVVELNLDLEVDVDKAMARREGIEEISQTVRVVGLMSSAAWGQGRSSADRQYTYINGRPCTLPTVMRAVNDVYKGFNTNQVPLAILDLQIPAESVDINVSPDKRTIFVHSEANLIEALRRGLEDFFQPTRSSFAVGGASNTAKVVQKDADSEGEAEVTDEEAKEAEDEPAPDSQRSQRSRGPTVVESDGEEELNQLDQSTPPPSRASARAASSRSARRPSPPRSQSRFTQQTLDTTTASWSTKRKANGTSSSHTTTPRAPATGRQARANLRNHLASFASQATRSLISVDDSEDELDELDEPEAIEVQAPPPVRKRAASPSELVVSEQEEEEVSDADVEADEPLPEEVAANGGRAHSLSPSSTPVADSPTSEPAPLPGTWAEEETMAIEVVKESLMDEVEERMAVDDPGSPCAHVVPLQTITSAPTSRSASPVRTDEQTDIQREAVRLDNDEATISDDYRNEIQATAPAAEATLRFDLEQLQSRFAARRGRRAANPSSQRSPFTTLREGTATRAAGLSNRDAEAAEEALARVISKADFARMQVLGQFNKGFIITRLKGHDDEDGSISTSDDLFIVDQHASDEKFNFETLQRTTVIKAQALIKPRAMQLTAADELVAMENLDVLRANGFEVGVDEDAPPGRGERVSLKAMPVSKETTFDLHDLEQLLHMLSDSSRPEGQMVRCTKARAMFAMRACRKSVMIGKSLTKAQMVTLLRNMGAIDQPWNCPHGRPTMRHLSTLARPSRPLSGSDRIDWSRVEL